MPLGYKFSEESKKKMSESAKKAGTGKWMKWKERTPEWREKMRIINTGRKHKPETIEKIRKIKTGVIVSQETRRKMSESQKRIGNKPPLHKGDKCHLWKGGITNQKYSVDWTSSLRISIRERDHYQCQICGKNQDKTAHPVHHIDYDKNNLNTDNLITLCVSCHAKTNTNRDYWKQYFIEKHQPVS